MLRHFTFPDPTVFVIRLIGAMFTLAIIALVARLVPLLERFVVKLAARHAHTGEGQSATVADIEQTQRIETLARVTGSMARAALWAFGVVTALGQIGIEIAPLIAGAGIAGVAVGFGAQSIVKDFFAGFFILLENQFDVGDVVTIAGVTGTVERMTLRTTLVRDMSGTAYFVPNSAISTVANKTYRTGRAALDVVMAANVPVPEAHMLLSTVAQVVAGEKELAASIEGNVEADGPLEFTANGTRWQIVARTAARQSDTVRRAMITALVSMLPTKGFELDGGVVKKIAPAASATGG